MRPRRNSGPTRSEQARQIVRAALAEQNLPGLSVAVGAGGEIVWAEGFGWANLENKVPVSPETRFRIGTASTVLTSAAVGLLLEKDRLKLDEKIQTYVPEFPEQQWPVTLRQVMGHMAGVRSDGGDEGPLFGETCDRPVEALQHFDQHAAVRAGDRVPLFELRLDPGERGRRSRRGRAVPAVHAQADLRAAGHEPHRGRRPATEPSPDLATSYFPRFAGGSALRPGPDAPDRPVLLRGSERLPVHPVRPGALRPGDQQRQAAATRHGAIAPDVTATALGTGDGLRSWLGSRDRRRWPANKRRWSATMECCWAGWWRR